GLNVVAHVIDERNKSEVKEVEPEIKKEEMNVKEEKWEERKKVKEKPKVEEKKQVEEKPKVEEKEEVVLKPVILQPSEDSKPSAPPVEIKQESEIKIEPAVPQMFKVHMEILESMGFTNRELNLLLLNKHNGNMQRVVDELLK